MTTPLSNPTPRYAFLKPVVEQSADTWGDLLNACVDAVETQLSRVEDKADGYVTPTGAVTDFLAGAAPAGWLALDGSTIGNAGSHAFHAAADAQALFTLLWPLPSVTIKDNGVAGTRGASAAADWTAGRQVALPNLAGLFRRMTGGNAGALGVVQADTLKDHTHGINIPQGTGFANGNLLQPNGTAQSPAAHYSGTTDAGGGGVETRPVNIAVLTCIKL